MIAIWKPSYLALKVVVILVSIHILYEIPSGILANLLSILIYVPISFCQGKVCLRLSISITKDEFALEFLWKKILFQTLKAAWSLQKRKNTCLIHLVTTLHFELKKDLRINYAHHLSSQLEHFLGFTVINGWPYQLWNQFQVKSDSLHRIL